ncbi:hypothetical protein J7J13_02185 [bacterium]|nr:hypothetical protein [bacterium]
MFIVDKWWISFFKMALKSHFLIFNFMLTDGDWWFKIYLVCYKVVESGE